MHSVPTIWASESSQIDEALLISPDASFGLHIPVPFEEGPSVAHFSTPLFILYLLSRSGTTPSIMNFVWPLKSTPPC